VFGAAAVLVAVGVPMAFPAQFTGLGIGALVVFLALATLARWNGAYLSDSAVVKAGSCQRLLRSAKEAVGAAEQRALEAEQAFDRLPDAIRQEHDRAARQLSSIDATERSALSNCDRQFDAEISQIEAAQRRLLSEQQAQLNRIQVQVGGRVEELEERVTNDRVYLEESIRGALAKYRHDEAHRYLSQFKIEDEIIRNIGPAMKAALRGVGIVTAADITYQAAVRASGIGPDRASILEDWRDRLLHLSQAPRVPNALPAREYQAVLSRHNEGMAQVRRELATARQMLLSEKASIRSEFNKKRADLDAELTRVRPAATAEKASIRNENNIERVAVGDRYNNAHQQWITQASAKGEALVALRQEWGKALRVLESRQTEAEAGKALTFANYVRRIIGMARRA